MEDRDGGDVCATTTTNHTVESTSHQVNGQNEHNATHKSQ
jgi:hypothetical protein